MGCGDSKEKIENEMVKMKMERIEVQMERQKQLKLLKDIDGCEIKAPNIPDYIDLNNNSNQNQEIKTTKKIETDLAKRKMSTTKLKIRKSKSLNMKNVRSKSTLNVRKYSQKNLKRRTIKQ